MAVTCAVRAAMASITLCLSAATRLAVILCCDHVETMVEDVHEKGENIVPLGASF